MNFDRAYLEITKDGIIMDRRWIVGRFATPETIIESAQLRMPGMYVQEIGRTEYEFGYRALAKKEVVWVVQMKQNI
jgi:hypothetical protein